MARVYVSMPLLKKATLQQMSPLQVLFFVFVFASTASAEELNKAQDNAPLIVGIIGGVVALAAIIMICVHFIKRARRQKSLLSDGNNLSATERGYQGPISDAKPSPKFSRIFGTKSDQKEVVTTAPSEHGMHPNPNTGGKTRSGNSKADAAGFVLVEGCCVLPCFCC